jgi:hypothetical protein
MKNFNIPNNKEININDLRNKYSQDLIHEVWVRLAKEGITNADAIIGTRSTINNIDFEKFWNVVRPEDIENLIKSYEYAQEKCLANFKNYKNKSDENSFVAEIGEFISDDTSFFDNKIADAKILLLDLKK